MASQPQSNDLDTFHPFPRLPIEIRNMVWELLIPPPRIHSLGLEPCRYSYEHPREIAPHRFYWYSFHTPPPAILFINRESFAVASKRYTRAFQHPFATHPDTGTWFDFGRDILEIDQHFCNSCYIAHRDDDLLIDAIKGIPRSDRQKVKNLALNFLNPALHFSNRNQHILEILGEFGGVENLYLTSDYARGDFSYPDIYDVEFWDLDAKELYELNSDYSTITGMGMGVTTVRFQIEESMSKHAKEGLENIGLELGVGGRRAPGDLVDAIPCVWEMPKIHHKWLISKDLRQKMQKVVKEHTGKEY